MDAHESGQLDHSELCSFAEWPCLKSHYVWASSIGDRASFLRCRFLSRRSNKAATASGPTASRKAMKPQMKSSVLSIVAAPRQHEGTETQDRRYPDADKDALLLRSGEPQVNRQQERYEGRGQNRGADGRIIGSHNQLL